MVWHPARTASTAALDTHKCSDAPIHRAYASDRYALHGRFFAYQQAALLILIAGLSLGLIIYAIAFWRVLRRVAFWQRNGLITQAKATLWTSGITALIIVLPLVVAMLLPHRPAP